MNTIFDILKNEIEEPGIVYYIIEYIESDINIKETAIYNKLARDFPVFDKLKTTFQKKQYMIDNFLLTTDPDAPNTASNECMKKCLCGSKLNMYYNIEYEDKIYHLGKGCMKKYFFNQIKKKDITDIKESKNITVSTKMVYDRIKGQYVNESKRSIVYKINNCIYKGVDRFHTSMRTIEINNININFAIKHLKLRQERDKYINNTKTVFYYPKYNKLYLKIHKKFFPGFNMNQKIKELKFIFNESGYIDDVKIIKTKRYNSI